MEPECARGYTEQVKTRDEKFFLESIEVEDTLFCVPKIGFGVDGSAFADMYAVSIRDSPEGSSVENPLRLHGVSLTHFRALLSAMYNIDVAQLDYEDWTGVFHLADMWNLTEIRANAVQQMTPAVLQMDKFEKIRLGQQCKVPSWTIDGCIALVEVTETPDLNYLLKNGVNSLTAARIFYVRETFMRKTNGTARTSRVLFANSPPESSVSVAENKASIRELLQNVFQSDE